MYQNGNGTGDQPNKITYRLNLTVVAVIDVNGSERDRQHRTIAVSNMHASDSYVSVTSAINDLIEGLEKTQPPEFRALISELERVRKEVVAFAQPRQGDEP